MIWLKKYSFVLWILVAFSIGNGTCILIDTYVYTPYVQQEWSLFDKQVKSWLPDKYSREDALALADAFELAASTQNENVSGLVKFSSYAIEGAVNKDQWKPFLVNVSNYCKTNLEPENMGVHIDAWLKISASLRKVS